MRRIAQCLIPCFAFAIALSAQEQTPPPPQIFPPGDLTLTNDQGRCYATGIILGVPRATDSAGGHTISAVRDDDLPLSDPFPIGVTNITWTVTDNAGQTASIAQRVTVRNTESPEIEAPPDVEVDENDEDGRGTRVDEGEPNIAGNCQTSALRIMGKRSDGREVYLHSEHPPYPAGNTTIVWTATDREGRQASATQHIVVKDLLPQVEAPPDVVANTDRGKCSAFVDTGMPSLSHRCPRCSIVPLRSDGKRRSDIAFPVGRTTIVWTVTTASGAATTAEQNVVVSDAEGPAITDFTISPTSIWPANGRMVGVRVRYHAADACEGAITTSLSVKSNQPARGDGDDWEVINDHFVDLRAASADGLQRAYTISVKAVDAAGNESTVSANVMVRPPVD
jgi:hypothetical protein